MPPWQSYRKYRTRLFLLNFIDTNPGVYIAASMLRQAMSNAMLFPLPQENQIRRVMRRLAVKDGRFFLCRRRTANDRKMRQEMLLCPGDMAKTAMGRLPPISDVNGRRWA